MSKNMEEVYTVNGLTGTLSQICIDLGLPYNTIKGRLFRGMTIEAALSKPIVNKNNNRKVYTVDGFTGNLTEVCTHFGVSYSAVSTRISRGVPIEDAVRSLSQKSLKKRNKIYSLNGFTGTLKEVCVHFEVPYDIIRDRIRRGKTLEEAVFSPISKGQTGVYTVNGFVGNIGQICRHFDIPRASVIYRMSKGMTLEEAINDPIKKPKLYTVNEFVGTVGQVCSHFGLSKSVVASRLVNGLSIEEAVNVPLMKIPTTRRYKGQKLSLKEICKIENKDYIEVYNLLKYCHTLEYAIQNASAGYSEE